MFDYLKFNNKLKNILTEENINNCEFDETFLKFFLNKKLLRANHASYVSKSL